MTEDEVRQIVRQEIAEALATREVRFGEKTLAQIALIGSTRQTRGLAYFITDHASGSGFVVADGEGAWIDINTNSGVA